MNKSKRYLSLILILVLSFAAALQVHATSVSNLEQQKKKAEAEKSALTTQLTTLVKEMEEIGTELDAKEAEITIAEEELVQAKIDENNQYESMKKRIKYMYETGNTGYIEILVSSDSMADLLNKAEYISMMTEYDRNMLEEFKQTVQDVEAKEEALKQEYTELESMQDEVIAKKTQVEKLVASTNSKISGLDKAISQAKEAERKKQEAQQPSSSGGAGASKVTGSGTYTHPCPGYTRISSKFGPRKAPTAGASTYHKGVDLAAPTGTPIYASASGTVISAKYSGNAGNMIVINHGNGVVTKYEHCSKMYVKSGQKVSRGQNIGAVGSTGNSTGPHLHYQVEVNGKAVNPMSYM